MHDFWHFLPKNKGKKDGHFCEHAATQFQQKNVMEGVCYMAPI
jgi:hypothetical protein